MDYRIEHDSMGEIRVPAHRLWGAQTERSLENFRIGTEKIPMEVIRAFALLKKAAARTNRALGKLDERREALITQVCDEILAGKHDEEFPLSVWQTGSGTQSNMNVNEVIANRANALAAQQGTEGVPNTPGTAAAQNSAALQAPSALPASVASGNNAAPLLHPNDHVNMSQSSNDTFPTAMHIAAVLSIEQKLLPAIDCMIASLARLMEENADVIKTGRTHLQDATPIRFSQEISGWKGMLEFDREAIAANLSGLRKLALGGTAVGTGLNAPKGFDTCVAQELTALCGTAFETDENKFHALTSKDALVVAHGSLKALAADLMKLANDIRWLSSGPRCGLGEIFIPENEPGSSIMPGKVNPTQCEAATMVAVQVMANDVAVGMAASQGNFELNVFMPVCIHNFLQSVRLLTDSLHSLEEHCVRGIRPNREKMAENLHRSLMLVTCLNPYIGYENAAKTAKKAYAENISLKKACVQLGFLSAERFDELFHPEEMV